MRRHDQIIISNNAYRKTPVLFYCGSAQCPVCNVPNDVVMHGTVVNSEKTKWSIAILDQVNRCEHASMAVDAGQLKIAVHFEWTQK